MVKLVLMENPACQDPRVLWVHPVHRVSPVQLVKRVNVVRPEPEVLVVIAVLLVLLELMVSPVNVDLRYISFLNLKY